MDASSRSILGLVSEMNVRFVVPVYQRPYSWGEQQCAQLWDDILACGRRRGAPHFTGSIVTVQDGVASHAATSSLLLIDGQQRITTIMLLLIALARHAAAHPRATLPFTRDEIVEGGYLTNRFRLGADHYKLTLSKGDQLTFQALVDDLEHPSDTGVTVDSRLADNLAFFEARLAGLHDVGSVWHGLQRLEVVAIALAQGSDNPQAIFESMNSTGKDLSSADLIRNFVLMSQPVAEQPEMYATYWRPLEQTLGDANLDVTFDDFVRSYLTVVQAPATPVTGDVYRPFKRHVLLGGYHEHDRMKSFTLRLRRFAGYYADVRAGASRDTQLQAALGRVARLDVGVVTALLMALLDAYDHHALTRTELLDTVSLVECYLIRRAVCDCAGSVMPTFVPSLVARLDAVRAEGGSCARALAAMLLNEAETARRIPTDAEFAHALRTRDAYHFAHTAALLAGIERVCGGEGGAGDAWLVGGCTVERVLPPRALDDAAWRNVLGADPETTFAACVNNLGNLTLTACDYELQTATLAEKQARLAGADGVVPAISCDIAAARRWDSAAIAARAERLTDAALRAWPMPQADEGARRMYRATGRAAWVGAVTFADLFAAGVVEMDDTLVSASPLYPGRATVTSRGRIMLADGETFDDPAEAYDRLLASLGAPVGELDGWLYWRLGEGGPLLDDLRARLW